MGRHTHTQTHSLSPAVTHRIEAEFNNDLETGAQRAGAEWPRRKGGWGRGLDTLQPPLRRYSVIAGGIQ